MMGAGGWLSTRLWGFLALHMGEIGRYLTGKAKVPVCRTPQGGIRPRNIRVEDSSVHGPSRCPATSQKQSS